jgi:DNA-directed RNA polymerase specialized sigma24 family protein
MSFEELPAVYRLAQHLTGNIPEAQELTRDIYRLAGREEAPHIYKLAIEAFKRRPKKQPDPKQPELWKAMDQLKDDDRLLLILKDAEQKPDNELADIFNTSPNSIRSRLAKARDHFREARILVKKP